MFERFRDLNALYAECERLVATEGADREKIIKACRSILRHPHAYNRDHRDRYAFIAAWNLKCLGRHREALEGFEELFRSSTERNVRIEATLNSCECLSALGEHESALRVLRGRLGQSQMSDSFLIRTKWQEADAAAHISSEAAEPLYRALYETHYALLTEGRRSGIASWLGLFHSAAGNHLEACKWLARVGVVEEADIAAWYDAVSEAPTETIGEPLLSWACELWRLHYSRLTTNKRALLAALMAQSFFQLGMKRTASFLSALALSYEAIELPAEKILLLGSWAADIEMSESASSADLEPIGAALCHITQIGILHKTDDALVRRKVEEACTAICRKDYGFAGSLISDTAVFASKLSAPATERCRLIQAMLDIAACHNIQNSVGHASGLHANLSAVAEACRCAPVFSAASRTCFEEFIIAVANKAREDEIGRAFVGLLTSISRTQADRETRILQLAAVIRFCEREKVVGYAEDAVMAGKHLVEELGPSRAAFRLYERFLEALEPASMADAARRRRDLIDDLVRLHDAVKHMGASDGLYTSAAIRRLEKLLLPHDKSRFPIPGRSSSV